MQQKIKKLELDELPDVYVRRLTCRQADAYDAATSDENQATFYKMGRMAQVLACTAVGTDYWSVDRIEEIYDLDHALIEQIVIAGQEFNGLGVGAMEDEVKN